MKRTLLYIYICLLSISHASAQTTPSRIYVRGSAVPGGIQQLTKFSTSTSGKYTFKYHGKLLPGNLYITATASATPSYYYAPTLVDTPIVTEQTAYVQQKDSVGAEWAVLFEADNYRFTVDVNSKQVSGELFTRWYEAWICGGCVADRQGEGTNNEGSWQITSGQQMEQDSNDPNVFEWTGLLKNYTYNVEPKRFKINGQYGWGPKVLHPFTQDASILNANVFEETIKGEYLGAEMPDGIEMTDEVQTATDDDAIYNLAGQRLSKPQRGLNIIGGKKVLIK